MGVRHHLDAGHPGHRANADILRRDQRHGRKTLSAEVPRRPVLVGPLPHPEDPGGIRGANVHRVHQLHHAAALHPKPEHEDQQPEAEVPGHQVGHHRRVVLLLVLDAQPGHHIVERVGQAERRQLGQSLLRRAHLRVPGDRVSGAHQQLPEPDHLLLNEEGLQEQA